MMQLAHTEPAKAYYESGWVRTLLDHKKIIQTQYSRFNEITNYRAYRKRYDFYSLLLEMGIAKKYHLAFLLINGLSSPKEFDENMQTIYLPDVKYLDKLMQQYMTVRR